MNTRQLPLLTKPLRKQAGDHGRAAAEGDLLTREFLHGRLYLSGAMGPLFEQDLQPSLFDPKGMKPHE